MCGKNFEIIQDGSINTQKLNVSMTDYDTKINEVIQYLQLPSENIVQNINERGKVFRNLQDVVGEISKDKSSMYYLSKFIYSAADGLFDAALNYLWDATISELREKISSFDVEYFYDTVVTDPKRRNKLHGEKDLVNIQDSDLLRGAKEIGLISKTGYEELNPIRVMRNISSTAHPTKTQVTGLQIITWLETCIRNVFNLPDSQINLDIKRLLSAVRSSELSDKSVQDKKQLFSKLNEEQISALMNGFFGIYTAKDSTSTARNNINKLVPKLWALSSNEVKTRIGMKYGSIRINGQEEKSKYAFNFIQIVDGQKYIPDDLKVSEIANILAQLRSANDEMNNFYIEPALAKQLDSFIGDNSSVPLSVENNYVKVLVYCFLTNGHGVAWEANDIYESLIKRFTPNQALKALLLFKDSDVGWKLEITMCSKQYKKMLEFILPNIVQQKPKDLIDFILKFNGIPLNKFEKDSRYVKEFSPFVEENLSNMD